VGGLVKAEFRAAGKFESGFAAPALGGDFGVGHFFCGEIAERGIEIVAHQVDDGAEQAVAGVRLHVRLVDGVEGSFGGRECEDEPASADVDRGEIQDVSAEGAVGFGVGGEEEDVRTGDR